MALGQNTQVWKVFGNSIYYTWTKVVNLTLDGHINAHADLRIETAKR